MKVTHGGTTENPNLEVNFPGHKRSCAKCHWYRRGIYIYAYPGCFHR